MLELNRASTSGKHVGRAPGSVLWGKLQGCVGMQRRVVNGGVLRHPQMLGRKLGGGILAAVSNLPESHQRLGLRQKVHRLALLQRAADFRAVL